LFGIWMIVNDVWFYNVHLIKSQKCQN
jgi:hypothetical protein